MPTLASTNRVQLSYKAEAAGFPGVPVTATPGNLLRITGESLSNDLKKESDKEIRSDRQRVSSTTVGATVGGGLNVHMQYGEYDALLSALMQSDWVPSGLNGSFTCSAAYATSTTITATAALPAAGVLQPGQWIQVTHPLANAGLPQLVRISAAAAAPTTSLITLDASTPVSVVASGAMFIKGARLSNGTTVKSFTVEMKIDGIAVPVYQTYRGMHVSKFSTSFNSGAMTDGTFDFMGLTMASGTATLLNASMTPSLNFDVQNAVTGVGNIWEAGAPLVSTSIKTFSLNIDNSLRAQEAIGTLGAVGIGVGTLVASGSLEIYFADGSLYNKFLTDAYTSLIVSTKDAAGNGYVFTFPKVQLTSAKANAGSKDSDLMASYNWEAYADAGNAVAALQKTLFIDRFGVAVTLPT